MPISHLKCKYVVYLYRLVTVWLNKRNGKVQYGNPVFSMYSVSYEQTAGGTADFIPKRDSVFLL